ncbi:MAG: NADH-ubiquinone oxidoreductase-F iron-sulfur binding region domain-containing protein [Acidimicrobiales bacterium]
MRTPVGLPRLLAGMDEPGTVGLEAHQGRWGVLPPTRAEALVEAVERSGLRGQGGAWFPVGAKWRSVRRSGLRSPVVIANGAEGEPASGKDCLLLQRSPHLVLDGATMAARATGAGRVVLYAPAEAIPTVRAALAERARRGIDPLSIEVVVAPDRFLAGQESAAVNRVNGQQGATPSFTRVRTVRDQGVGGRPTLVQNVESLAHAALIVRFGPDWFRDLGTPEAPGTVLLTVSGRWDDPRIVEVPLGGTLGQALGLGPDTVSRVQGVLLGGYGGGWVRTPVAMTMPLTEEAARRLGSSLGAGVVALLPAGVCPLAETARVVRYLEGEGAGQCGPCVNGLDALATTMERLAFRPDALHGGVSAIPTLCALVEGRGACRHPDGVARFVRTALDTFGDHTELHLRRGACHTTAHFLPVPMRSGVVAG